MTITLNGLRFHAFHGIYPEEQKTGNEFLVDLAVTYLPDTETITDIEHTINYVALYELIKKAMRIPRGLLETLAMEITGSIHELYPQITSVDISIKKLHPPVEGFIGNVGVRYQQVFSRITDNK
jgi:7,8-dihydroneopterin aldolase/epimerase/oxygenase